MMIKHAQNFYVMLCMFVMMIQQIKDEMKIVDLDTVYLFLFQFSILFSLTDMCGQTSKSNRMNINILNFD